MLAAEPRALELPSGVRVVVTEPAEQTEVRVSTHFLGGAALDPPEHPGLAHLVEHMMLRGPHKVALHGHGCDTSASTDYDAITIVDRCPPEALPAVMAAIVARLEEPVPPFDERDLAIEGAVVRHEMLDRLTGSWTAGASALAHALYPAGHPYGHALLGSLDRRLDVSAEDIEDYARHLVPERAVVVIQGDVEDLDALVEPLALGATETREPIPGPEPFLPGVGSTELTRVEGPVAQPMLLLGWTAPVVPELEAVAKRLHEAARKAFGPNVRCTVFSRLRNAEVVCVGALKTDLRIEKNVKRFQRLAGEIRLKRGERVGRTSPADPFREVVAREGAGPWSQTLPPLLSPDRRAAVLVVPGAVEPVEPVEPPLPVRDVLRFIPASVAERPLQLESFRLGTGLTVVVAPVEGEDIQATLVAPATVDMASEYLRLSFRAPGARVKRVWFAGHAYPLIETQASELTRALKGLRTWVTQPRQLDASVARRRIRRQINRLKRGEAGPPIWRQETDAWLGVEPSTPDIEMLRMVGHLTNADVIERYETRWQPRRSTLILAGDIDVDTAREAAEDALGTWSGARSFDKHAEDAEAVSGSTRRLDLERDGPRARVRRMCRLDDSARDPAMRSLLSVALKWMTYEALRLQRGLTYRIGTEVAVRSHGEATLEIVVAVSPESVDATVEALDRAVYQLGRLAPQRVAAHGAYVVGALARQRANLARTVATIGGEVAGERALELLPEIPERLAEIDADRVAEALGACIDTRFVVVEKPE